jgi:hypothetical protein
MKQLRFFLAPFVALIITSCGVNAQTTNPQDQLMNDVVISWDQMMLTASLNKFMNATGTNQDEILRFLINEGYNEMKKINRISSEEDKEDALLEFNRKVKFLKRYFEASRNKNTYVLYDLDTLMEKFNLLVGKNPVYVVSPL